MKDITNNKNKKLRKQLGDELDSQLDGVLTPKLLSKSTDSLYRPMTEQLKWRVFVPIYNQLRMRQFNQI